MGRFVTAVLTLMVLAACGGGTGNTTTAPSPTQYQLGRVELSVDWDTNGPQAKEKCQARFTVQVDAANPDQYTTTISLGTGQLVRKTSEGGFVSTAYLPVPTNGLQGVHMVVTYGQYTWDATSEFTCPTSSTSGHKVLAKPQPQHTA